MEDNVQTLRPERIVKPLVSPEGLMRNEFLSIANYMMDVDKSLPVEWQRDLLRRYQAAFD